MNELIDIKPELKNARILIVDDMAMNRMLLDSTLRAQGFVNLHESADGAQALKEIIAWKPDLVLLDLMMPEVDGESVCRKIPLLNLEYPPIIVVQTAVVGIESKRKLFALGVTDYITKPLDVGELIARCVAHLEKRFIAMELNRHHQDMQKKMREAAKLQNAIMPSREQVQAIEREYRVEIGSYYTPSEFMGGDFWDIRKINTDCFAMSLVDFSGHGLLSALSTFRMQAMMGNELLDYLNPARVLHQLNHKLHAMLPTGQFATMLYMVVDRKAERLHISSAGALPPIIISAEGTLINAGTCGMPLGVVDGAEFDAIEMPFRKGDALLLMSDGLAECSNGEDSLNFFDLLAIRAETTQAFLDSIVKLCQQHSARRTIYDDETAVLMKAI